MDVREKLVELLHKGVRCPGVIDNCNDCPYYSFEKACDEFGATVDLLIANGVTVQECGYWVSLTDCANAGVYCSVCHKKVYKEDYAWCNRKNKLRSDYCPHCGAKMMPQPPKGE